MAVTVAGLATVSGVAFAGCGSGAATSGGGSDVTSPAQGGAGVTVEVQAIDNRFRAAEITVKVGTEVNWTNAGRNNHDVVPVEGDDWGVALGSFLPDTSYSHVFTEPGTYRYYCSAHGTKNAGMMGTVTVVE